MSDDRFGALVAYVQAAAALTRMPLNADRLQATATIMTRIAEFAANVEAFALADDVEIAGTFRA